MSSTPQQADHATESPWDRLHRELFAPPEKGHINRVDVAVIIVIVLFATLYFLGRWRGAYPFVYLGSDASFYANIAAIADNPAHFAQDVPFGDPAATAVYQARVLVPLVQLLTPLTGDYGTSFIILLWPHIVLQLVGYYWLGRLVVKARFWAFIYTFIVIMPINFINWGIKSDPIATFSFQALLPYLLALVFLWRAHPWRWLPVMFLSGLMIYVHPASALPVGFALWGGLWVFLPPEWPLPRKMMHMGLCGLLFVMAIAPFLLLFLGGEPPPANTDFERIYAIVLTRVSATWLNPPLFASHYFQSAVLSGVLPAALLAAAVLVVKRQQYPQRVAIYLAVWMGCLLFVTVGVAWGDVLLARARGRLPLQVELTRQIRYLTPILLLLPVWALRLVQRDRPTRQASWRLAAVGLAGLLVWTAINQPHSLRKELGCLLRERQLVCPQQFNTDLADMVTYIAANTAPDATFLGSRDFLEIRYGALRSLVYSYKDGAAEMHRVQHPEELYQWDARRQMVEEARLTGFGREGLPLWIDHAREFEADYLLLDSPATSEMADVLAGLDATIVYANDSYTLIDVAAHE